MSSYGSVNSMEHSNPQAKWLVLIGFAATVIVTVGLLTIFSCFRCRIRLPEIIGAEGGEDANDPENSAGEGAGRGIDEATLDSYPRMLYSENVFRPTKSDGENELVAEDKSCCSICLSDYRESEVVRSMPDCGHMFHAACIDQWLRRHATCPLCRTSPLLQSPLPAEPRLTILSQP